MKGERQTLAKKKEEGKYQEWGYLILYRGKCNQRKKRVIAIARRKARMEKIYRDERGCWGQ